MKPSLLVVSLLVVSLLPGSGPLLAQGRDHVRALDAVSAETLERALAGSALVRELVSALDRSDVIVHIQTPAAMPAGLSGTTRLVASTLAHRYVRTALDRDRPLTRRAALLGHELQHAWEIAQSPARDRQGLRALFSAIGWPPGGEAGAFETDAAVAVEVAVWRELRGDADAMARERRSVEQK